MNGKCHFRALGLCFLEGVWKTVVKRMKLRLPLPTAVLLLLAFVSPSLMAQDGWQGAVARVGSASSLLKPYLGPTLVPADFDNDRKPDGALLLDAGIIGGQKMYRVQLHLSAGEDSELLFAASDPALSISAQDVNRDGTPDLVVEQALTHKRVRVWLNDGHGTFRQARVEDFPAAPDAPLHWRAPNPAQSYLIIGLPSRFETHHAAQLLEILRFDSSSSHWRVWREEPSRNEFLSSSDSPRAPPVDLPL